MSQYTNERGTSEWVSGLHKKRVSINLYKALSMKWFVYYIYNEICFGNLVESFHINQNDKARRWFHHKVLCTYWLSGRAGRLGPYGITSSQIFSRPARPNWVNKHLIIWPDFSVIKSAKKLWNTNRNIARKRPGPYGCLRPRSRQPLRPPSRDFLRMFS